MRGGYRGVRRGRGAMLRWRGDGDRGGWFCECEVSSYSASILRRNVLICSQSIEVECSVAYRKDVVARGILIKKARRRDGRKTRQGDLSI